MVISASFLDSAQKTECSTGTHLPIFGSSGILILKRKSLNPELHVAANFDLWLQLSFTRIPNDLCCPAAVEE